MKIIDLLNKIANEEEVPKKIAIQNKVLIYNEDEILNLQDCYCMADDEDATWEIWAYELNEEVEILEEEKKAHTLNDIRESYGLPRIEEKKIPEKSVLDTDNDVNGSYDIVIINGIEYEINKVERYMFGKINEIIDYLDFLKSKGDE